MVAVIEALLGTCHGFAVASVSRDITAAQDVDPMLI